MSRNAGLTLVVNVIFLCVAVDADSATAYFPTTVTDFLTPPVNVTVNVVVALITVVRWKWPVLSAVVVPTSRVPTYTLTVDALGAVPDRVTLPGPVRNAGAVTVFGVGGGGGTVATVR